RLGDRAAQHRARDSPPSMAARDTQPLVPDQPRRVRSQPLYADHRAVDLSGLELGARLADPPVEHARKVVAPLPHVARDVDDAVVVGRPDRPQAELVYGCQCATPESAMPPSKTSSSPCLVSTSSSTAAAFGSSQASPNSARESTSASSML